MSKRLVVSGLAVLLIIALAALAGGYMMLFHMPGHSFRDTPSALNEEEEALRERLQAHVYMLAKQIGERHYWQPESKQDAATYITQAFRDAGYEPTHHPIPTWEQTFYNVEVRLPGNDQADESLVIGAHYDTVRGSPGADDNASGVAALLELARLLHDTQPERTIRLVAFANEEAPFFGGQAMGSLSYARQAQARGDDIVGMISLEMLGYYTDEPQSQYFPPFLDWFYPDQGNFVAFVGNLGSRQLIQDAISAFRDHAEVPSEGLAAPERLGDIHRSDHWSFWRMGYPAMMLTDTANFRTPHYHGPHDTPETLNYDTMTRVTVALAETIKVMAR